jgi:hypothetical protein
VTARTPSLLTVPPPLSRGKSRSGCRRATCVNTPDRTRTCNLRLPSMARSETASATAQPLGTPVGIDRQLFALGLLSGSVMVFASVIQFLAAGTLEVQVFLLLLAVWGGAISLVLFSPVDGRWPWLLGLDFGALSGLGSYGVALLYFSVRTPPVFRFELFLPLVGAVPGFIFYLLLLPSTTSNSRAAGGSGVAPRCSERYWEDRGLHDGKSEPGTAHDEVRGRRGRHHHLTLRGAEEGGTRQQR